jgi:hypothetical protein
MLYALPYCTSSLYSSTELPTRIPAPSRGGSKRRLHQSLLLRVALIELQKNFLAELLLQQWSGPTVAVTNLELFCCCCCCWAYHSYLATVANAGIGWRGRVLSCNSNLRVPCIGFESILSGVRFSSEVQSISPLSSCSTYSTVAPVLIDAQGQTNQSLCRLVRTYLRMVAPVLIDAREPNRGYP